MTVLLDAACKMAEHPPTVLDSVTNRLHCGYCGQAITAQSDHAEDCPWLAQGQIVVALVAAERIVAMGENGPWPQQSCWFCLDWRSTDEDQPVGAHKPDCRWQALMAALMAALKGDA